MSTELFLIRHGSTDYNKEGKYCSFSDIPLNQEGICQVAGLKERRRIPRPDVIYASQYKRAEETARMLFPNRQIELTSALAELHFGLWEGLTFEEISVKHQKLYMNWLDKPYSHCPPSGEEFSDLERRVVNFLQEIIEVHQNKKICCVSHAGPIRIMISYLLKEKQPAGPPLGLSAGRWEPCPSGYPLGLQSFWKIRVDLASVSYFRVRKEMVIKYFLNINKRDGASPSPTLNKK